MPVSKSAPAAGSQHLSLSVLRNFNQRFTCFGICGDRSERNFQNDIFAIRSFLLLKGTGLTVPGNYVFSVFEMKQGPELPVPPKENMARTEKRRVGKEWVSTW